MTKEQVIQENEQVSFKDTEVEVVVLPCSQEELYPNGAIANVGAYAQRYSAEDIRQSNNPEDVRKI